MDVWLLVVVAYITATTYYLELNSGTVILIPRIATPSPPPHILALAQQLLYRWG